MEHQGDLRRHQRNEISTSAYLSWADRDGNQKFAQGRVIDVSEIGMRIEMREPLARQAYLSFRVDQLALQGSASVRSCKKQGTKYVLGLEFAGGLKWKPKAPSA
jgi:hypothetical protein